MWMGWLLLLFIHANFTSQSPLTNTTCDLTKEFDCGTGPLGCLPIDWKCDNVKDCYNGADEIGCPRTKCKKGELICLYDSFEKCVDGSYKCDGIDDCGNYRDEMHCEYNSRRPGLLPPFTYGDPNSYKYDGGYDKDGCLPGFGFCAADDDCIPNEKFCNGAEDCGWYVQEDERNCTTREPVKEIDHCTLKKRACHHFCENLNNGSFICSCAKGYELENDGKTCKPINLSEGSLLLSDNEIISRKPLEDYSQTLFTPFHKSQGVTLGFDYLRRDDKLFVSICKDIYYKFVDLVVEENGKQTVLLENHTTIAHLNVDWIGGNLFFIEAVLGEERNVTATITVCTMDLKFCHRFFEMQMKRWVQGFVIHPMRGLFFWVERPWTAEDRSPIMMANMDGSQVQTLVDNVILTQSYFAIDYGNNDLYFQKYSDSDHFIRRINIDTRKIEIISQNLRNSPATMIHHNGFLYMTGEVGGLRILEVKRKNARIHDIPLDRGYPGIVNLRVNDSLRQIEPSHNPCKELECPWICVIVPGFTAKCLCPDGYNPSLNGTTCIPFDTMQEYCKKGVACLNGGVCREVFNNTRIVCDCVEPYDGLYCERRKPMMSNETILLIAVLLILPAVGYGAFRFSSTKEKRRLDSLRQPLFSQN